MCELFGVNSARSVIANDLLKDFYSHSNEHPQGWGLALFHGGFPSIEKEPVKATQSRYLDERLNATIRGRNVLAHIRLATIGNMEYNNCHPFLYTDAVGTPWTMVHNGTLFEAPDVDPYFYRQAGTTDSERMLLYLVDQLSKAEEEKGGAARPAELTLEERIAVLDAALARITVHAKLNMLLFDGEHLYVHSNYANSLHIWQDGDTAWFSTQPLKYGTWEPVPFCRLSVFQNGQRIYTGTSHGHEYIDNPEDLKFLNNFAML